WGLANHLQTNLMTVRVALDDSIDVRGKKPADELGSRHVDAKSLIVATLLFWRSNNGNKGLPFFLWWLYGRLTWTFDFLWGEYGVVDWKFRFEWWQYLRLQCNLV
ncbi:MAG: hypothetical protein VX367_04315, partial [SAR324 cluster bacterium]|nr:hypothetical protein [SAR324 cluster bacterium]